MQLQIPFHQKSEIELIREEVKELRESMHKQRKALFARHGELAKMYVNLTHEFDTLQTSICKNGQRNDQIILNYAQKQYNTMKYGEKCDVFEQFQFFDLPQAAR